MFRFLQNSCSVPLARYVRMASLTYFNQAQAAAFDEELMAPGLFSVDQLMELAGLSVASAVEDFYPPKTVDDVVVLCGPGNNGGDGLVAARHLVQFGYNNVQIVYPKATTKPLYLNLMNQARLSGVQVGESLPQFFISGDSKRLEQCLVIDAIFGFSFKGDIREPFATLISLVKAAGVRSVAVDIPSGWDVELGDSKGAGINPSMLVSLTLPKEGVRQYAGPHYVGGRFIPAALVDKHKLVLPSYERSKQFVRIDKPGSNI